MLVASVSSCVENMWLEGFHAAQVTSTLPTEMSKSVCRGELPNLFTIVGVGSVWQCAKGCATQILATAVNQLCPLA